ncbi:MAG TPA: PatB family C-S lyase [Candidatus Aminicenantes bacterium]|nr:PatB family C-S lyase [Candidatus Aminicenantes bacterium]HRY64730.1 PatB family C-S lyase [Candidatus Aminicenantes bacterium]HRZ71643.1 PatB family C-S lyase [Candidatus Aminicenantes bacterium]
MPPILQAGAASPFDKVIDRCGTESMKWTYPRQSLGAGDAIPMWVADMDFEAPPAVIEALVRRAEHGVFGYPLAPDSFYEAAADWMRRRHAWTVAKDWISMTPGIVAALHYLVRGLTEPGDGVIIQTPVYHPFFDVVEKHGRRLIRNPLRFDGRRYQMDLDDLGRRAAGARMIILCSPHNPVGRVWTREELEGLGRIAVERDLLVVSDEIHHDLVYQGHTHQVFAALDPALADRTVTCVAPSKTFNIPGLSTAAVVASNPKLLKAFEDEAERCGFDLGQVFGIVGFEAAYRHGQSWLEALLPYLEGNVDLIEAFVAERLPAMRFIRPEGTYLGLLDARGLGLEPGKLGDFFLKQCRVYFSDGAMYGRELEGFVRINFGCPRSVLLEALERIERAVRSI